MDGRGHRSTVAGCTESLGCGELVGVHRVADHSCDGLAVVLRRDRDGEPRETVEIVRRAVDRIDQPANARCSRDNSAFLTDDGVVRPARVDASDDQTLGSAVHIGDHVGARRLRRDLGATARQPVHEQRRGLTGEIAGDGEQLDR